MINSLTAEQAEKLKAEYISLLQETKRENIESLIEWLEKETDFFTAPASGKNHAAFEGGLLVHSLNVYKLLLNFLKNNKETEKASIIIAGLLHDICKVNFYKKTVKNVKIPGEKRWVEEEGYAIDDSFPLGHGEKSLFLAERHIRLTDSEAMAIRWHMSGYDDAARAYSGGMAQSAAFDRYPLAAATAIADMYATYFADKRA